MPPQTLFHPTAQGKQLNIGPECFGTMRSSIELIKNPSALRTRIQEEGYLFLPGLLNRDEVIASRLEMASRLGQKGLLDPDRPVMDCVAKPGVQMSFCPDLALDNEPMRRVLYQGPMMEFFRGFFGEEVLHFTYTWVRAVAPGLGTPPHYDSVYMGRGTHQLFTAWTPMGDITPEEGGLMVLENSHKNERLIQGYGQKDVDSYCLNKPYAEDYASGKKWLNGWLTADPVAIQKGLKGRWLTNQFRMGDVVIFWVFVVHGGMDNHTDRIRLSTDTRYQRASEPADQRWIGQDPPGHGPRGKLGRIC